LDPEAVSGGSTKHHVRIAKAELWRARLKSCDAQKVLGRPSKNTTTSGRFLIVKNGRLRDERPFLVCYFGTPFDFYVTV